MKFAIWIAVILALVSVAGILVQEFFPVRDARQAENLAQKLPGPAYQLFVLLELHDPFRALWFRTLLGLLALSLGLCAAKNIGPLFRQAFTVHRIEDPRTLLLLPDHATLRHTTSDLFEQTIRRLRRRLFVGSVRSSATEKVAALHAGGLARTGAVLLHMGILVLVLGGLVSSLVGRRSVLFGSPGEILALEGSPYSLRVDDFQIEQNERGQVKQYRSQLAVLEGGREIRSQEITVNHPLRFGGFNIYQASYQADPARAAALRLAVRPREGGAAPHGATADAPTSQGGAGAHVHGEDEHVHDTAIVTAGMDSSYAVPGHEGYTFRVRRFFAHLTIGENGPVNASRELANPAAEIEIQYEGRAAGAQWAFLHFPAHARGDLPFVLELRHVRPAVATGLEVNTNPGAPLVWAGIVLSTLGLLFGFLLRHRTVYLIARPAERGWTLWLAGRGERERFAFTAEFQGLVRSVHAEARRLAQRERAGKQPAPTAPTSGAASAERGDVAGDVVAAAPTQH